MWIMMMVAAWSFSPVDASQPTETNIVAKVNGSEILQKDFTRETKNVRFRFQNAQPPKTEDEIQKQALDNLIGAQLLYNESKKAGITVSDEATTNEYMRFKKQFPSPEMFDNALKQEGLTDSDLKSEISRSLTIREFIDQKFTKQVTISDEETRQYYNANQKAFVQPEMVKARHILITVPKDATEAQKEESRKKLEGIQKKVTAGEDFAELAKTHSQCPSSSDGGNLGEFTRGQMVKPFETAAFSLEPGQVSPIVETQFGYHLIKVEGKTPERTMDYDHMKKNITRLLTQEKVQAEVETYLKQLKSQSKIEYLLEPK